MKESGISLRTPTSSRSSGGGSSGTAVSSVGREGKTQGDGSQQQWVICRVLGDSEMLVVVDGNFPVGTGAVNELGQSLLSTPGGDVCLNA